MAIVLTSDPYAILGVDRSADDAAIASARRRLARTFHPDVSGDGAAAEMMRINAAFDRIRDRRRRAAYAVEEAGDRGTVHTSRNDVDAAPRNSHGATARAGLDRSSERDGTGGAGPAPGRPSGSVLGFGRHIGWSIGEIARVDPGYLVWLEDRREGRPYLGEIDRTLRQVGSRLPDEPVANRAGRFRR